MNNKKIYRIIFSELEIEKYVMIRVCLNVCRERSSKIFLNILMQKFTVLFHWCELIRLYHYRYR